MVDLAEEEPAPVVEAAPVKELTIEEQAAAIWDDADVLDDLVRHTDEPSSEPARESHFS